ncbi:hypothetical protein GCM10009737_16070 [Nocardioides lentus]|uniref:DUF317 domain-containing protein n=1 Tax=Nocardioides lentus TaxID=338077 RepID=A0ABP5AJL8_9ACTN
MISVVTVFEHVAYLHVETGDGLLVLPPAHEEVWLGSTSVHAACWADALAALDGVGWEPSEGDDGGPCVEGMTRTGREVIGLFGRDPIRSEPSLEDGAAAYAGLLALAAVADD